VKYRAQIGKEEEDAGNEANGTLKDAVPLNVGGEFFSISLATRRAKTGTYIEKMFQKGSTTTCSAVKTVSSIETQAHLGTFWNIFVMMTCL